MGSIKIAEWMGKCTKARSFDCYADNSKPGFYNEDDEWVPISKWTPELGGKDLTEVLAKLKLDEPKVIHLNILLADSGEIPIGNSILLCIWFQDDKNAEIIIRALTEVIK